LTDSIQREASSDAAATKKLRILAVIPGSENPAAFIFARRQMADVAARGHDVRIFDLRRRRSLWTLLPGLRQYRRVLRDFMPDVVHAHYGAMTGFFSAIGALGAAPVVVTFRGSDLNPAPLDQRLQVWASHLLSQASALFSTGLICVSEELRRRLWWGRSKVTVVPTGVDLGQFHPGDRLAARASLGWDLERPIVLFSAQSASKRRDTAEATIALARRSLIDIEFVVIDGFMAPEDIPPRMRASDCLLFTSDYEGSPTMVQEAMACGLPVVSVAVGDVPERLTDVRPSHVVARDPAKLAEALVTVLRERRRSNGFEIARRDVAAQPIMLLLEKAYTDAAERSRAKRTR